MAGQRGTTTTRTSSRRAARRPRPGTPSAPCPPGQLPHRLCATRTLCRPRRRTPTAPISARAKGLPENRTPARRRQARAAREHYPAQGNIDNTQERERAERGNARANPAKTRHNLREPRTGGAQFRREGEHRHVREARLTRKGSLEYTTSNVQDPPRVKNGENPREGRDGT